MLYIDVRLDYMGNYKLNLAGFWDVSESLRRLSWSRGSGCDNYSGVYFIGESKFTRKQLLPAKFENFMILADIGFFGFWMVSLWSGNA